MKCPPAKLPAQIAKKLSPVYLVFGDEPLQVMEASDVVRVAARSHGYLDREVFDVDKQFDWSALLTSSMTTSLFSQKKVIELRLGNGKIGDKGSKALLSLLDNLSTDTLMLLVGHKIEKPTQRAKWFSKLDTMGMLIQAWPIEGKNLPQWISQRLQAKGIKSTQDAVRVLAEYGEGNLLAVAQEIEKLALLDNGQVLNGDTVSLMVANHARFDIYGLVDACLAAKHRRIIRIIQGLKSEGVESILILWALSREIRSMAMMAKQLEQGLSLAQVLSSARVWPKRKPIVSASLQRLSTACWQKLLLDCGNIDRVIKGLEKGLVWDQLLQLCLSMAGIDIIQPEPVDSL